jgi:anaerobic magnesium-protoporphyrin IX monomethyl ester cyclase
MKIALIFPPQWAPTMPYLSVPILTAFLRSRGLDVEQRDLNVELYDAFLSRRFVRQAVDLLRQDYGPNGDRTPVRPKIPDREAIRWAINHGSELADQVEQAKAVIRGPSFYEGPVSLNAFMTLTQALGVVSLPYFPTELEFTRFRSAYPADESRSLLQSVQDPLTNPFLGYFRSHVLPDLERSQPDIVGISIPTMNQMLAGMTLAYLIKQTGLNSHITVGGPHITMLREQLPQVPQLFDLIDSAVIGAGELPLLGLVEALDEKKSLSNISNLIYKNSATSSKPRIEMRLEKPVFSRRPASENGKAVEVNPLEGLPDFDGLPLTRYFAPNLILPLLTAHGCYHGRCAFCNVGYDWSNSYHQLPAEQVVDQMLALKEKYAARHIFFADEAITPKNLRRISALLEERGSPIHWGGCVRFEHPLSADLLNGIDRGGGRMMLFGLETASEVMIERMDKGTQLSHMGRILKEASEAGIWNHTFFFFGFPGETVENAQDTVNFVYAHQEWIHSASLGTFLLERYAPAHLYPDRFGIRKIVEMPERDLAIYFDYELSNGIEEEMAETLVSHLLRVIPQKENGHYYIHDSYKLLYAGFLHEQGRRIPAWLEEG